MSGTQDMGAEEAALNASEGYCVKAAAMVALGLLVVNVPVWHLVSPSSF